MINRNGQLLVQSELVELDDLAEHLQNLNKNLSKEERQKTIRGVIVSDKSAPEEVITAVERILNEYGVAQIDIRGTENTSPPAQNGATQKQLSQYNTLAKKYNAQPKEKRVIPSEGLKSLEHIYRKMSEQQKADARPFPECPDSKSSGQEGATEKQMAEYNALAKKYNDMLRWGNIRIKKFDVDFLEYLHGLMTEEQRANSEPFPDLPEPPETPVPPSPTDPGAREFAANKIQEIIENQDPHDGNTISIYNTTRSYYSGDRKACRDIIAVEAVYPPSPTSPLAPNQNLGKPNQWTVTSGANRDSRNAEASSPIPPVTPTIAMHVNRDNYSNKLKNSINQYLEANKIYEEAVADYRNKSIGDKENLWNMYNEAMEKYVAYHVLAKEEGNFVQQIPAFKERAKVKKDVPPAPLAPPQPKAPLDYIIKMAKKDARFYYKEKEIGADKAIELMKKNKNLNIHSKAEKEERPVVKLSTDPIEIKN